VRKGNKVSRRRTVRLLVFMSGLMVLGNSSPCNNSPHSDESRLQVAGTLQHRR
jgi:hypothetical protein